MTKNHISFTSEEISNFLKISGAICLGILSLLLLVVTINQVKTYSTIGDDSTSLAQNTISVNGTADMDVKPDITVFSWTVQADGKTTQDSQSKSATINNKAIAYVKSKGIKDADIKTIELNTYPKYSTVSKNCIVSPGAPGSVMQPMKAGTAVSSAVMVAVPPCVNTESAITGYTTSQSVEIKVRNIESNPGLTGELVAGLAAIGVQVSTPSSTVEDMDSYKRAVRDQAILNARQEAELLANSLGVRLVKITSFNDNSGAYPYAMDSMMASPMMAKSAVVPDLPTGTNKITSNVTITYQIK